MAANDVIVTAANVRPTENTQVRLVIYGATVTAGDWLYRNTSTDKYLPTTSTGTLLQSGGSSELVWAMTGGADTEDGTIAVSGKVIVGGALGVGKVYVISDTVGLMTLANDLASTWYTGITGVASSTTELELILKADGYRIV